MNESERTCDVGAVGTEGTAAAAGAAPGAGAGAECVGCALASTRRDFLREGSIAALAIFASFGLGSRAAAAMPIRMARRVGGSAETKTYALPASDGAEIDRDAGVILVRWQSNVYAFNLSCPHQNTALRWDDGDRRFRCPKHHSEYQPDGTFIKGRATRGMDRFPISRQGGNVVVDLDHMIKQTDDMAAWQAAVVKV